MQYSTIPTQEDWFKAIGLQMRKRLSENEQPIEFGGVSLNVPITWKPGWAGPDVKQIQWSEVLVVGKCLTLHLRPANGTDPLMVVHMVPYRGLPPGQAKPREAEGIVNRVRVTPMPVLLATNSLEQYWTTVLAAYLLAHVLQLVELAPLMMVKDFEKELRETLEENTKNGNFFDSMYARFAASFTNSQRGRVGRQVVFPAAGQMKKSVLELLRGPEQQPGEPIVGPAPQWVQVASMLDVLHLRRPAGTPFVLMGHIVVRTEPARDSAGRIVMRCVSYDVKDMHPTLAANPTSYETHMSPWLETWTLEGNARQYGNDRLYPDSGIWVAPPGEIPNDNSPEAWFASDPYLEWARFYDVAVTETALRRSSTHVKRHDQTRQVRYVMGILFVPSLRAAATLMNYSREIGSRFPETAPPLPGAVPPPAAALPSPGPALLPPNPAAASQSLPNPGPGLSLDESRWGFTDPNFAWEVEPSQGSMSQGSLMDLMGLR